MRYPYPDVTIEVEDDKDILVEVTYPDAGSTGNTFINIPGGNNKPIENAGSVSIGSGKILKGHFAIIASNLVNVAPQIDKIRETITVDGVKVVQHENLKSDDKTPSIKVKVIFQ
jgi:hypothetical protein